MKKRIVLFYFLFFGVLLYPSCKISPTESSWKISSAPQQGFNEHKLDELTTKIQSGIYKEIHSVLIVRNGYLVYEKYFHGYSKDKIQRVYSVTKSVTSLLVGIANDKENITNFNAKLLSFFHEYGTIAHLDSNKRTIRLEDILTMRAGFTWNEQSAPYGSSNNPAIQLSMSSDWIKYVLDVPMSYIPGTHFTYNSGCSILLSGILLKTTNKRADVFGYDHIFSKLGIVNYAWDNGPKNITNTGWGLYLKPRDMAKIGQLVLNRGTWNGKRIVSSAWIDSSTTKYVTLQTNPYSYGYQWWLLPLDSTTTHTPTPNDIRFAWGYGGQFIFVIPYYDLVVVSTAWNPSGDDDLLTIQFMKEYIIKAIQ